MEGAKQKDPEPSTGKNLPDDWVERKLYSRSRMAGVTRWHHNIWRCSCGLE